MRRLFAASLLAVTGLLHAAPPDQRFGVMTHFAQGWPTELIPSVARAGLGTVRDEIYWDSVEATKGRFQFPERSERFMSALKSASVSPLIELTFANHHYDNGFTPYTEAGFAAYARYGVEVLRHYGSQIGAVEIWNEYNGTFCEGPATASRADTYARMLKSAYAALKRERPGLIVAGGATSGIPLPYFEKLFTAGALASLDAVSVHPYRLDQAPEGLEEDIAELQQLMAKFQVQRPIWVTEIGWATRQSAAPGDLAIDELTQAKFLVRAYGLLLSSGVGRVYWYLFRDYNEFPTMGLVRADSAMGPKPAYTAYAELIRELSGAEFVRRDPSAPDVYSLLFRRGKQDVRVLWSLAPSPVSATVKSLKSAHGMLGESLAVANGKITLTDAPIYLEAAEVALPPAPKTGQVLANSRRDFSGTQGANNWRNGSFAGDSTDFVPLPDFRKTDDRAEWFGPPACLSIVSTSQHPGSGDTAAVRRWTSPTTARVQVAAQFRRGVAGDGSRVRLLVDGRQAAAVTLGGGQSIRSSLALEVDVRPGTTLDLAVDGGAQHNIDFDETWVAMTISLPAS